MTLAQQQASIGSSTCAESDCNGTTPYRLVLAPLLGTDFFKTNPKFATWHPFFLCDTLTLIY